MSNRKCLPGVEQDFENLSFLVMDLVGIEMVIGWKDISRSRMLWDMLGDCATERSGVRLSGPEEPRSVKVGVTAKDIMPSLFDGHGWQFVEPKVGKGYDDPDDDPDEEDGLLMDWRAAVAKVDESLKYEDERPLALQKATARYLKTLGDLQEQRSESWHQWENATSYDVGMEFLPRVTFTEEEPEKKARMDAAPEIVPVVQPAPLIPMSHWPPRSRYSSADLGGRTTMREIRQYGRAGEIALKSGCGLCQRR